MAFKIDAHKILQETNCKCYYCGAEINYGNVEMEHVIPKSRGGSNRMLNIVSACKKCNRLKGIKLIEEWRSEIILQNGLSEYKFYFERENIPLKGHNRYQELIDAKKQHSNSLLHHN
jgi:HNH endonuclease